MAVQELQSTDEFRALIDKNELAVVLFYDARAAGKSLFQLLRGGAEQLPHVAFGQGDVNKHPEIYEEYVSRGDPLARHPCLICYRDGHALFSLEMSLTTTEADITRFLQQVAASE